MAVLRVLQLELRPVEVRTDSAYVLNGVTKHRAKWKLTGWRRKNKLISNADLWQKLDSLLVNRSPESYSFVKVKGHLDIQDVFTGAVSGIDKHGNDAADSLAVARALENCANWNARFKGSCSRS